MKITYVCSATSRISTGKTPQLRVTQHLGSRIFWKLLHSHVLGLLLAVGGVLTRSTYMFPLHVAWASSQNDQLRVPIACVPVNKVRAILPFLNRCWEPGSILLITSTLQAHPDFIIEDIGSILNRRRVKKSAVFFKLPHLSTSSLKGNILSAFKPSLHKRYIHILSVMLFTPGCSFHVFFFSEICQLVSSLYKVMKKHVT